MSDDRNRQFATTRWTVVLQASDNANDASRAALQELCEAYWQPLYSFVRSKGFKPAEAADLTQGFFVHLFEKKVLEKTIQYRGKFRSFLLVCIQNFLNNELDRQNAQKRGGGIVRLSLNLDDAESKYALLSSEPSPESAFEKEWACSLLAKVHQRLLDSLSSQRVDFQKALLQFLTNEPRQCSYEELASEFAMTKVAVRVAVFRLREKFRKILHEEVGETIEKGDSIEEEITHLLKILTET